MSKRIQFILNPSEITAGTRGASLGPQAILTAARSQKDSFFADFNLVRLEDRNDVLDRPTPYKFAKYFDHLLEVYKDLDHTIQSALRKDVFPFILAGDHGSAAGTLFALKNAFPNERLGVIWIDAHGDLHTPYTTPSGNMHGMPLALAMHEDNLECAKNSPSEEAQKGWEKLKKLSELPAYSPEDLLFIAVRDTEKEEDFLIQNKGIRNISVDELRSLSTSEWQKILTDFIGRVDRLYVSFDVDSMDPDLTSYGTGTPVANGLKPDEAMEILTFLARQQKLTALEVVEVNPCLDNQCNRMAEITFDIIKNTVKNLR